MSELSDDELREQAIADYIDGPFTSTEKAEYAASFGAGYDAGRAAAVVAATPDRDALIRALIGTNWSDDMGTLDAILNGEEPNNE